MRFLKSILRSLPDEVYTVYIHQMKGLEQENPQVQSEFTISFNFFRNFEMNGKKGHQFLRKCVFFVTKILDVPAYYGSHGPPRDCSHKRANKLPGVSSLELDFRPNPSTRSRSGGSRSYAVRTKKVRSIDFSLLKLFTDGLITAPTGLLELRSIKEPINSQVLAPWSSELIQIRPLGAELQAPKVT